MPDNDSLQTSNDIEAAGYAAFLLVVDLLSYLVGRGDIPKDRVLEFLEDRKWLDARTLAIMEHVKQALIEGTDAKRPSLTVLDGGKKDENEF